ncbi:hypothetical protein Tco_1410405 [Tanacetum coccineum]
MKHDRFNDLLRGSPHHGFSELHQLDTFYNALKSNDQDSLNSAAGGNFLDKMPLSSSTTDLPPLESLSNSEIKRNGEALLLDKKYQSPAAYSFKAVEESLLLGRGLIPTKLIPATSGTVYQEGTKERR